MIKIEGDDYETGESVPMSHLARFLTVSEVAKRLGLHTGTVYRLVRNKTIPAVHVGGSIRVLESSLAEFGKEVPK